MVGVVLAGRERHRRFSEAQKIAIIGESFLPSVRVREVMERYGLASSVIYTWRKQARQGHFSGGQVAFAPVAIVESEVEMPIDNQICVAAPQDLPPESVLHDQTASQPVHFASNSDCAAMVVALPDGVRILVNNGVDEGALGRVLRALAGVPAQTCEQSRAR